jgi:signal transduction histidine kinase
MPIFGAARDIMRDIRNAAPQNWAAFLKNWISYQTPPGVSSHDHLVATLLRRMVFVATLQGLILILPFSRLLTPRLPLHGLVLLFLTSLARVLEHYFGARAAFVATYCAAEVLGLVAVAVSGGIYGWPVMLLLMLTISLAFVVKIRTTLLILSGLIALLIVMSFLQTRGIWFPRILTPSPGTTGVLLTLTTINITIPVVTTIQACREAMAQLETKLGALHAAEAETRRLLDVQSRFFWDVSHELRSPLTRLNLSLGKVRRESGPQSEPSLERMGNEVERLNKLIHQLLLLAQLKHDVQFPMNQRFDLAAEVASVCEDAEFEANVAGRDLHFQSSGPCPVEGCAELLRGALDNVVRNAIRFAPEASKVEVHLSQPSPGLARIAVEDRGPGVPQSQIAMLFDPFFRVIPEHNAADGPAVLHQSGSGLGLAIAFEAVKKHGGRISAANRPGGGLQVIMEIPTRLTASAHSVPRSEAHVSAGE